MSDCQQDAAPTSSRWRARHRGRAQKFIAHTIGYDSHPSLWSDPIPSPDMPHDAALQWPASLTDRPTSETHAPNSPCPDCWDNVRLVGRAPDVHPAGQSHVTATLTLTDRPIAAKLLLHIDLTIHVYQYRIPIC